MISTNTQELFGAEGSESAMLLNDTCLAILAHALTSGLAWSSCTRFRNGLHFMHGRVAVVEMRVEDPAGMGELSAVPAAARSMASTSTYTASFTASYQSSDSQAQTPAEVFAGRTDGNHSAHPSARAAASSTDTSEHVEPSTFDNPSANPVYRTTYDPLTASLHLFLEPLVLERSRLTSATILRLLPLMAPRRMLFVAASRPEDRSHEQGAGEAVFREAQVMGSYLPSTGHA